MKNMPYPVPLSFVPINFQGQIQLARAYKTERIAGNKQVRDAKVAEVERARFTVGSNLYTPISFIANHQIKCSLTQLYFVNIANRFRAIQMYGFFESRKVVIFNPRNHQLEVLYYTDIPYFRSFKDPMLFTHWLASHNDLASVDREHYTYTDKASLSNMPPMQITGENACADWHVWEVIGPKTISIQPSKDRRIELSL